jgi:hypothetical protein
MADPLSPRAAPATGPREPECLCRGRYPFLAHHTPDHCGALAYVSGDPQAPACSVCWTPLAAPASPPPEPAEERRGCADGPRCDHFECVEDRQFRALETRRAAPALPRPEGHVHGPGCTTGECGVCGTWHCMAHLKPGAKWLTDLADCPGPAASAPPPRPEESAEFARGRKAGIEEAARHLRERCCGRWDVQFIASELEAYIRRHPDLRALSAPPPGEERLREALSELRQQVEDTVLVATTDTDDEGWITAYHFKTGAIHRLIAKARGPIPSALRAALREDEKGAKP